MPCLVCLAEKGLGPRRAAVIRLWPSPSASWGWGAAACLPRSPTSTCASPSAGTPRPAPDAERRRRLAPILLYPSRHMGLGRLPRLSGSPIIARARGRERELPGCRQCKRLEAERDPPSPSSRVVFTGRADGDRDARSPPACSLAISASYGRQRFVVRVEGRARPAESSSFSFPFPRPPRAAVARRAHGAFVPWADVAPGECRARA